MARCAVEPDELSPPGPGCPWGAGWGRRWMDAGFRSVSGRPIRIVAARLRGSKHAKGCWSRDVVDELRNYGAFVTLLPGARGLLLKCGSATTGSRIPRTTSQEGDPSRPAASRSSTQPPGKAELSMPWRSAGRRRTRPRRSLSTPTGRRGFPRSREAIPETVEQERTQAGAGRRRARCRELSGSRGDSLWWTTRPQRP